MGGLPPVPRDSAGAPCPSRHVVLDQLCPGILGCCRVCDQATGWWWRHGRDYYPLHDRCIGRLVELWAQVDDVVAPTGPVRRTGAYARRAAAHSVPQVVTPVQTGATSRDGGSPYFRPGMPAGAPWVACVLTMAGVAVAPCSLNEQGARDAAAHWGALGRAGFPHSGGAQIAGSWVVDPDGTVFPVWGQVVAPGEALPWEPLTRLGHWETCRGCAVRMWPGCWRGDESGLCAQCLRPVSARPSWPTDAPCWGVDPLTVVLKKKAKRDKVRAVD